MNYIAEAFGFFVLVVLSHALACRRGWILFQMEWFLALCLVWGGLYFALLRLAPVPLICSGSSNFGRSMPLVFTSFVLYGLLCLAYLVQCTAIQVQSPSMKVVSLLRGGPGMTRDQLRRHFSDEEFVLSRLRDLVRTGYVNHDSEFFSLTPKGFQVARVFDAYQRLIRRNMES